MGIRGKGRLEHHEGGLASPDERLRVLALERTSTALLVADDKGRCVYMNEAAKQLTGYQPDEIAQVTLHDALHGSKPDGAPCAREECPLHRAFANETPAGGEETFVRRDGSYFPAAYQLRPLSEEGEFRGMVLELSDITGEKDLVGTLRRSAERLRTPSDSQIKEWIGYIRDATDERALEEVRSRLAAIVESSGDAILGKTLDGIITAWNRAAQELFGYSPEEAIGKHISLIVPEAQLLEEESILTRLRAGERSEYVETVRRAKDGRLLTVSLVVSPVFGQDGKVVGASSVARDISVRRRATEAQAHLAAIVESSDDAIVSKNLDGIIRSWNRGAERLFGYEASEAIGRHITLIIPDDRVQEEVDILARLRRGERINHLETVRRRKDGSLVDVSLTISPIKDSDGRVVGASKVARDISERKRAEEALREHTRTLEVFNRVTAALAADLDPSRLGHVLASAGLELSGAQRGLFVYRIDGKEPVMVAAGAEDDSAAAQLGELATAVLTRLRTRPKSMEDLTLGTDELVSLLGGDGADLVQAVSAAVLLPSREEEFKGCLLFAQAAVNALDARQRVLLTSLARQAGTALDNAVLYERTRRLNEELEEMVRRRTSELENLNGELEAFSYSVSHDLRAPLRGIAGFSQILVEEYGDRLDGDARHYLERIQTGIERMGHLIDDLLALSRLTKTQTVPAAVDLGDLAKRVISDLAEREPGRNVEVVLQGDLQAIGDASLLRVLLENLLGNAWKFTAGKPEARIEVGELQRDGQQVFYVKDNGVGFSMRYVDKLFVPFQRLHDREEYEGSGIGLATVQRIVRRHGGVIWGEGDPGVGATFYFTLPGTGDVSQLDK